MLIDQTLTNMFPYQKKLAILLAESGALFFREGLRLKDGRSTPYFINFGKLCTGQFSLKLGYCYADWMIENGLYREVDVLLGPSYKGSAIVQAAAIALYDGYRIKISFDYDRKEAKLFGEKYNRDSRNIFVTDALVDGARVLIIDDVLTSINTKVDLINKLKEDQYNRGISLIIKGIVVAVDREQTQAVYDEQGYIIEGKRGKDPLKFFDKDLFSIWSLLGIRTIIKYLYKKGINVLVNGKYQLLDEKLLNILEEYFQIYSREENYN